MKGDNIFKKIQDNENVELVSDFSEFWFKFKPYKYQKNFLDACLSNNRIAAKWCRQAGKSHTVAVYSLYKALISPVSIMIVAPTQSQSSELYSKVRETARSNALLNSMIIKSTGTELRFKNGSRIKSLPCGPDGKSIRGFTADIIIVEEAGIMKDEIVNTVIIPMIASKKEKGQIIKIGTPLTKNHFYNSCFNDDNFSVINVTWRDCIAENQYSQDFVDEQRRNLTDIEFRTEYEAEFIDDNMAFFPTSLLEKCKEEYCLIQGV